MPSSPLLTFTITYNTAADDADDDHKNTKYDDYSNVNT